MSSADDFARQLDNEFDAAMSEIARRFAQIGIEAATEIVNRTPVRTGLARGNWFTTVGTKTLATTQTVDPSGGGSIGRAREALTGYGWTGTLSPITIQNNLPYIVRLENGYSKQAPNGMVAVTAAGLKARYG